jgi:hypothetical protein
MSFAEPLSGDLKDLVPVLPEETTQFKQTLSTLSTIFSFPWETTNPLIMEQMCLAMLQNNHITLPMLGDFLLQWSRMPDFATLPSPTKPNMPSPATWAMILDATSEPNTCKVHDPDQSLLALHGTGLCLQDVGVYFPLVPKETHATNLCSHCKESGKTECDHVCWMKDVDHPGEWKRMT